MNDCYCYLSTWTPGKDEELLCEREEDNAYNIFATKVMDSREEMVGHLPKEIFCSSYFLILCGATLNCIVTDDSYYHSLIVQGRLEILCKLHVSTVRRGSDPPFIFDPPFWVSPPYPPSLSPLFNKNFLRCLSSLLYLRSPQVSV